MSKNSKNSTNTFKNIDRNLYERGGYYYHGWSENGKQRWKSLKTKDEREARSKMAALPKTAQDRQIAELLAQNSELIQTLNKTLAMMPVSNTRQTADTLQAIFDQYLSSRKWDSHNTLKMYQGRARKLTAICKNSFQTFLETGPYQLWRKVDGSPAIQNHTACLLRGFTKFLTDQKLIPNQKEWLERLEDIPKEKTKSRKLLHVPTPQDVEALCNQIELEDKQTAELCRLLAYTGVRIGGAMSLDWAKMAPDLSWVEVNEKGDKARQIQLPDAAKATLERIWKVQGKPVIGAGKSRPVFRYKDPQLRPARNALKRAVEIMGSPLKTFHWLRHWFTTQAIKTYDVRSLAAHLGHEDGGALLLRTYAHYDTRRLKELAETLPF